MIGVFFESLFSGRILFLMIATCVAGFAMGNARLSVLGWLLLIPAVLFVQMWLFVTADYVEMLTHLGETGAAGFKVGDVFTLHLVLHPALLIISIWIGRAWRAAVDQHWIAESQQITPETFVGHLDVLGAHPDLAVAGWFDQRWNAMDAEDRLRWAEANIGALRHLWLEGGDSGLAGHNINLPMLLAEIDAAGAKADPRRRSEPVLRAEPRVK